MFNLPSYVIDTTDFIIKVKDIKLRKNTYLVTLNVSSLYTSIPNIDGINTCKWFLEQNGQHRRNVSTEEIASLTGVV